MNQYWVLVRLTEEPGSAVTKVYINAENPFAAISLARGMYGSRLLTEAATPA